MDNETCAFDALIEPYLDDKLGEKERLEFEEHKETCNSCREQLELAMKMDVLLQEMEEDKAPLWLAARVIAHAKEIAPISSPAANNWLAWVGGMLLGLGIAATIAFVIQLGISPQVANTSSHISDKAAFALFTSSNLLWALTVLPIGFGVYKLARTMGYL